MKILFADSLEGHLSVVKRLLRGKRYEILTTQKGEKILELLGIHSDIDLVIVDMDLSGDIQGAALIKKITQQWPDQAWLMTGSSWHPSIPDKQRFLQKPYNPEALIMAIQKIIKDL